MEILKQNRRKMRDDGGGDAFYVCAAADRYCPTGACVGRGATERTASFGGRLTTDVATRGQKMQTINILAWHRNVGQLITCAHEVEKRGWLGALFAVLPVVSTKQRAILSGRDLTTTLSQLRIL